MNPTYYIRAKFENGLFAAYELYAYENDGTERVHERRSNLIEILTLAVTYYGVQLKLE